MKIGERKALTEKIDNKAKQLLEATDEVRENWINRLLKECKYDHEKYVIVMGYLFGLRPLELMKMTSNSFKIIEEQDNLIVKLPTVKKGNPRTIILSIKETPFGVFLANYVKTSPNLLPLSWTDTSNINQVFKRVCAAAETGRVSFYVFRKMRLSYISQNLNPAAEDLLAWKGSSDLESLKPYLMQRPNSKWRTSIK